MKLFKHLWLFLTVVSLFLTSCNGSGSIPASSAHVSGIGSVNVEATKDRIIMVTLQAESGHNHNMPVSIGYPHGKFYYLNVKQSRVKTQNYTFATLGEYQAAKARLDSTYASRPANLSSVLGKVTKPGTKATSLSLEYGYDIGVIPSTSANINGSGGIDINGNPNCYNYTAQVQGSGSGAFSSEVNSQYTSQATTTDSSFGASANISASDGLYSGSGGVSYSSSYQGSQSSYSFSFLNYVAANVLLSVYSISNDGLAILQGPNGVQEFIAQCGNAVVTSIPMGYSSSVLTTDSSSSESQNSAYSASLSGSSGNLDSFSSSVNGGSGSSSTSDDMTITSIQQGDYIFPAGWSGTVGGTTYYGESDGSVSAMSIFEDWENSYGTDWCTTSTTTSQCSAYMTTLSTVQNQIATYVENALITYGLPTNLATFEYMPNGVTLSNGNGDSQTMATTNITNIPAVQQQLESLAITGLSGNDAWAPYQSQLESYTNLLYQVNQLYYRAYLNYSMIVGGQGYPTNAGLDVNNQLANALYNLYTSYQGDIHYIRTVVDNCLNESSTCASMPILSNGVAYSFYSNSALYQQVMEAGGQQYPNINLITDKAYNSIFLQYQANYTENAQISNPYTNPAGDSDYNGPSNPEVNNTVPMGIIYLSEDNLQSAQMQQGLLGFALQGVTLNNPYWPWTGSNNGGIPTPFLQN